MNNLNNSNSINNQHNNPVSIPLKDSLFLSPIEKYKIYGRFPWKLMIHILLVIATSSQAILIISVTTQYTRAQERLFYNSFISNTDKTNIDYDRKIYLYSINDIRKHLNNSVQNYYNLKDQSLENIEFPTKDKIPQLSMDVNYINNKHIPTNISDIPREFIYYINQTDIGPFQYPDKSLKDYINTVTEIQINYLLKTYVPFYYSNNYECFYWIIKQNYNYLHRAHFVVTLNINRIVCNDITSLSYIELFINRLMWIHILVISLATTSLILTWKYVYKISKLYWRVKSKFKNSETKVADDDKYSNNSNFIPNSKKEKENKWTQLQAKDKRKFFNMWSLISLLGNIVQIFGSGLSLFDTDNIMASTEILVGFGCMLAYINIGRYLEYNRDYSTIFATIQRSLPNVLRYLLGVMPIFFGFIFFGLCLFWRSERFTNTSSTMITLFAMLNGDSVFDIFNDLTGVNFFLGQVYCYIFCIIFIVVVMNVFISIIEEAYVSTKIKNQNHWIYSYLKIDPKYVEIKDIKGETEIKEENKDNKKLPIKKAISINSSYDVKDRQQRKIVSDVKSKNILREIISDTRNMEEQREDIEKILNTLFNSVEKSINEVERISNQVVTSNDNNFKDELRLFIFDHITTLEGKLNYLRSFWVAQN